MVGPNETWLQTQFEKIHDAILGQEGLVARVASIEKTLARNEDTHTRLTALETRNHEQDNLLLDIKHRQSLIGLGIALAVPLTALAWFLLSRFA